ncbi:bifunctional diaminohydroxyphosphoribosylaminopyrimidine deaminase/5-amino-6-(5-phosphoribosylamino)uracil reductase [Agromyces sp. Root81]|uniref:bifunctional diaminohydroxyphosphoribosylaminopyrimidine deaminase/5-amino-6-(5-phosphoribosylamino)uracil reductase RibD n=1 Tax=Agromyces sp. Root81 TaxID=1736601 RepID=UPI0006F3ACF3|nr:bifunctional diaminohydroxyphosphoribosylaminopyrimidine deaminase/5-amino-6-(5-phosphoribosylamino)uracil reductase RibD [Agromyces sp. Root81]KRC60524.1 bifunctional diaminohydroxyphosphoribosylaminopyrimidine deaminase/5-amino-6-(5-phosphoribosylamino)uracil reductase [Agromyces sp. Root81]
MSAEEQTAADVAAMRRALELATRGPARGVNPRVGCVILSPGGEVVAEGWHRGAGTTHAEVDALAKLEPGAAHGATAVVTLEPCNHTGHTGPCAVALIEAGIGRVVYAVADPGDHSSGGAQRLRDAGVEVTTGVLADEVEAMLDDWLFAARNHRPHVTVKWASSLDGRAAAADGTSQWITGGEARADVHRRRSAADAIAVGTGTVFADDPSLTARAPGGEFFDAQPVPVVFGRRETPSDAAITRHPHAPLFFAGTDLRADLAELAGRGIRSLFIEGGPTLASAFIADGLVDELLVYLAPTLLGGPRLALGELGVPTIDGALRFDFAVVERLGDDLLLVARPKPTEGN